MISLSMIFQIDRVLKHEITSITSNQVWYVSPFCLSASFFLSCTMLLAHMLVKSFLRIVFFWTFFTFEFFHRFGAFDLFVRVIILHLWCF